MPDHRAPGIAAALPDTPAPVVPLRPALAAFALDAAVAFGALFGLSFAASLLWGFWRGIEAGLAGKTLDPALVGQPQGPVVVAIAVAATASAALIAYVWRRRASAAERAQSTRRALRPATWVWALMVGLGTFLFSLLLMGFAAKAGVRPVPSNASLLQETVAQHAWLMWLAAVALAPAYEELLFRRVLFGRLWAAGRPWLGAILSAALFALLHELPGHSGNSAAASGLLWLSYGVMGLAFAWVYRATGTLWAAIAAHAVNNFLALALMTAAS